MEHTFVIITFAAYLIFMLAVGLHFYKRNETFSDYLIGDRQLNKWVTSLSAQASDMSGWLLLGMHNIGILGKINQLRILQLFGFYHGFNFSEQTAMTIKLNQAYFRKVITKMDIV